MKINEITGDPGALGLRFGIVASRFNDFIVDRLLKAAVETLVGAGADAEDLDIVRVPGAFEIPLALKLLAGGDRYDGLLAIGCVIRGETPHFDYVAGEASRGVADVSLEHRIPVGFGILTVDTFEQANARSGPESGNKGAEAALAVIEMANLRCRLTA